MNSLELLEDISSAVVLVDVDDKPALGKLMEKFENLLQALPKTTDKKTYDIIIRSMSYIKTIILDDAKDPVKAFNEVSKGVSELQVRLAGGGDGKERTVRQFRSRRGGNVCSS